MAGHWISANAQVRSLAKAVAAAFASSVLTDADKSPGKIAITDLPWAAPPLVSPGMLGGASLQDYLSVPTALDEKTLHRFWRKTLDDLWHRPSTALRRGTFANCGWAMPKVRLGQRAFLFSQPLGFPARLDHTAGAMFTLEVVHAAAASLPIQDFVSDDNSCYVDLASGERIGIVNGKIAGGSPWEMNTAGQLQDMITSTRGEADYVCQFDQLASLRSVLHVHRRLFPHNFEALDLALQALRLLTLGGHCPELVSAMRLVPIDAALVRTRERALRDAIETTADSMADRSKLQVLHSLLVPEVISASKFKQHIYAGAAFPFALAPGKVDKIKAWLVQEYQSQVPQELRQLSL